MRLVVRFPTHRVLSCLGHYWWGQTRKWAHFAVKFPFAACFWYKNFWNIGRKCEIFWSQQSQIRVRIGIPGRFSGPTQKIPKKSGVELRSYAPLHFFGIFFFHKNFLPGIPVRHWIWDCGYEKNRESAHYWKSLCSKNSPKTGKNGKKRQKVPMYPFRKNNFL